MYIYPTFLLHKSKKKFKDNGTTLDQNINSTTISNDLNTTITEKADNVKEKVLIQLYYECLCPFCTHFYTEVFIPTIREIGDYLDVRTYPYGNAWVKFCQSRVTYSHPFYLIKWS
ncbi:hypothetical protein RR46_00100 [Papilio xuthus]|uniref:Gamma-interferon-inducible lysosomal thiol reductase n=1 Tax=Papilio xuthus TaxID=66420 RepID=A0A0N1PHX1_PAPXU|nr:hypothetical protein RR46_00100 [Papilio xuthus]